MAWGQSWGKKSWARRLGLLAVALGVIWALAGCNVKEIVIDAVDLQKFDASETTQTKIPYSGQRIVIDNAIGVISVEGSQEPGFVAVRPFVTVEAVKKVRGGVELTTLNVRIEQNAKEIHILSQASESLRRVLKGFPPKIEDRVGWIEYKVRVPQSAALTLRKEAGVIEITRFKGDLIASVKAGGIFVHDSELKQLELDSIAGDLQLKQSQAQEVSMSNQLGDIRLEETQLTSARLASRAGSISIIQTQGKELTAATQVSGGISVAQSQIDELRLTTQAGSIKLVSTKTHDGQLSTQVGGIAIELPLGQSLRLAAQTQFGGIKLRGQDNRVQTRWSGFWPGKQLMLTVGEGEDQLTLSTQVGSIRISFVK
jgi:DUF4097 and DUF4098 domain-containing protein YvlB